MDHTTNGQIPHRVFFDAAAAAYEDGSPPPKGYRPVKRFEHRRSGFKAVVYQNDEGERIYAIAGLEDSPDLVASLRLGEGQFRNDPFDRMIEDAQRYSKRAGKTVTFTGHSLGGGLAQVAAHEAAKPEDEEDKPVKVRVVSWAAFGGRKLLENADVPFDPKAAARIDATNYFVKGDPIAGIGRHIGPTLALPAGALEPKGATEKSPKNLVPGHSRADIGKVLDAGGLDAAVTGKPEPSPGLEFGVDAGQTLEPDDKPFRLDDPNLASRGDKDGKQKRTAVFRARRETALTRRLGAAADADDLRGASPEAREFLDAVAKPGSRADEILLKPVSRWTDDELGEVMGARLDLPSGHPERDRMADKETEFFKRFHGAGTTPPIPKDVTPARAPDGGDLASALRRVGAHVVRAAGKGGLPPALRDLQRGINVKRDAATALKVDGAFGPLTRTALRRATADQGSAGVERLFALGRFHGFAEDAERDGPAGLADTLEKTFARPPRTRTKPVGALKRTLNDLGRIHFGRDAWRPLNDNEGRIGPETTSAFAKVLRAAGPKLLTERYGRFLGIL